ncbi:MAG: M1 family metallopeptidase [Myxococcales bacterium]|nr:M1 family metallopeptidase [Myxococcales bacterium]
MLRLWLSLLSGISTFLPVLAVHAYAPVLADAHSFANPSVFRVQHLDIDIAVDFVRQQLHGDVELHIQRITQTSSLAHTLILDTRDLQVHKVDRLDNNRWTPTIFSLGEAHPILGTPLSIPVLPNTQKVRIRYETSPDATGLQWLQPEQTAGKQHPFLYSQAQAIHARSFLPLQDSPQVRVTYKATIRTPSTVRAVMSANNTPAAPRNGIYTFAMPQPIPSYLIALAVGDLHFKAMGSRTGVYAELPYLEAATKEFEDTEKMLEVTETIFGPYAWDRYDILILPPSFPFGGMENPRLSFITPTIIAKDKSLVSLIAHELAHSWSGNLVTNASWNDLWLNEGFTTYLTYRIMELVYGKERWAMERVLGQQSLMSNRKSLAPSALSLVLKLDGHDPDDAFNEVPYEQGALFLFDLERQLGRPIFDNFLHQYFKHYRFKSLSSAEFFVYVQDTLGKKYPAKIDLQRVKKWLYSHQLPSDLPLVRSEAFTRIDATRNQFINQAISSEQLITITASWTVHEWLHFLNNMPAQLNLSHLKTLDQYFHLSETTNNEIAHSWLLLAIRHQFSPAFSRLKSYLLTIGRRKLIKPLYQELMGYPEGKKMAQEIYLEARPGYHYITQRTLDAIVRPAHK